MQDNYKLAVNNLFDRLIDFDKTDICSATGCIIKDSLIYVNFFYETVVLDLENKSAYYKKDNKAVTTDDILYIIPYLLAAKSENKLSNQFVGYRNIKKAAIFEGAYLEMLKPLKRHFTTTDEFISAALKSKGEIMNYKDYSVKIYAFDYIPLIYVFNEGDEEFPSNITVLFDTSITDYIHEENVPMLGARGLEYLIACKNS